AYDRISHVGGFGWQITQAEAIRRIEAGVEKFEIVLNGQKLAVMVGSHNGHKYLKTSVDTEQPNRLLSLPECG
ncbi:MAG TPA: DUF3892 domain-containing protein, partial [Phototrophicaceae bacterium]|nr:DUF3892 domain-containing protein [Phototrophicaceae bacterium]